MSEKIEKQNAAGRSDDGATFQRERFQARCLALQYLYMCDVTNDWYCPGVVNMPDAEGKNEGDDDRISNFLEVICSEIKVENPYIFRQSRKYFRKLIVESCQRHEELDEIVQQSAVNWALHRMDVIDRCILRLATCEMRYFPNVPDAAIINEAVELAKKFGSNDSAKFVNGVLESVRKAGNQVILPVEE